MQATLPAQQCRISAPSQRRLTLLPCLCVDTRPDGPKICCSKLATCKNHVQGWIIPFSLDHVIILWFIKLGGSLSNLLQHHAWLLPECHFNVFALTF
jgi:hypothetical protein